MKFSRKGMSLAVAVAVAAGSYMQPAWSADAEIEEVVVTGSYIKGSPEDAELPIDVLTNEDLTKMGSPSVVEMVRNLGVTAANLGETNQFTSGGQANERKSDHRDAKIEMQREGNDLGPSDSDYEHCFACHAHLATCTCAKLTNNRMAPGATPRSLLIRS